MRVDATGLQCPLPVLRLQKALRAVAPGGQVTLLASDPMARIDVPHFCSQHGHHLDHQDSQAGAAPGGGDLLIFEVIKGPAEAIRPI
jgi:tRNA 2-thiouridine synthesizing protein A